MSFQTCVPHFDTGGHESQASYLSDEVYGLLLDNISKGVSDMLIVHPDGGKILVGKRNVHPQPDWWIVGGRMMPGETSVDSCRRLLKREISLDIHPNRFSTVCCQTLAWHMRQQEPKNHGTADLQIVLSFQLEKEELSKVVFDADEYDEVKWVDVTDILNGNFHPALKYPVHCLLTKWKMRNLQNIIDSNNKDKIAHAAKEFVQGVQESNIFLLKEQSSDQSEYRVQNSNLNYEATVSVKAPGLQTNEIPLNLSSTVCEMHERSGVEKSTTLIPHMNSLIQKITMFFYYLYRDSMS